MPPRRAKHTTPSVVLDATGQAVTVGGHCGLFIDMPPNDPAPTAGDWIATEAGSRYLVDHVHVVRRRRDAQARRYQMRCLRLPKHTEPPSDIRVIWLSWYPRGARR